MGSSPGKQVQSVNIRVCSAEKICRSAFDYEQSDRSAAFYAPVYIINSSVDIFGNSDMFGGDICSCSGIWHFAFPGRKKQEAIGLLISEEVKRNKETDGQDHYGNGGLI